MFIIDPLEWVITIFYGCWYVDGEVRVEFKGNDGRSVLLKNWFGYPVVIAVDINAKEI